ncbi:MAG: hypothetical protein J6T27_03195 [Alphaproteobacteria bacterium]|nr:hypothetical protein [Alphaproteobacteria bacterium]
MKKIIVAICGITIVHGVFADHYATPKLNNRYNSDWKVDEGAYDTGLEKTYSHLNTQYGQEDENGNNASVKDGDGTYDDEKAIVIDMARSIYRNGANFCTTQIQAGNINGREYVWLDYYKPQAERDNKLVCKTICKPGYDPDKNCDEKIVGCNLDKTDNIKFFYDYDVVGSDKESGRIDGETEVFSFLNETGMGASNQPAGNRLTRHVVLAIVKKLKHGVIVAPVQIEGKRDKKAFYGGGIQSWVRSAKYSASNVTLLCNAGYVANTTNTDCVQDANCSTDYPMCNGFNENEYDENKHVLKTKNNSSIGKLNIKIKSSNNTCTYFECKSGYAPEVGSSNKLDCVECPTGTKQGINKSGYCEKCGVGELFGKNSKQCKKGDPIDKEQLKRGIQRSFDCWQELGSDAYSACVKCKGTFNTTTKECE